MLRLFTFGGLWLESDTAEKPVAAPRRLALLALVAAAGRKGISRDRVLALLWPEATDDRARHSLSQTLYSLRKELGCDPIAEATDLRLNPVALSADVADLQAAAAAGDTATVARLYSGPFLDGFHLTGSAEFETWAEEERSRLRDVAVKAIETLADSRGTAGDWVSSAEHWRHLARLEPLNARYAGMLMRALAASGNRAGALSHLRQHEAQVRVELETPPESGLLQLAEELRRGLHGAATVVPPGGVGPSMTGTVAVASGPDQVPAALPGSVSRARPHRRLLLAGLGAVVLLALAITAWRVRASARVGPDGPVFAVGTIRDRAAPDSGESGGEVLSDMVATSLATVEGLRVVGSSRLYELLPRDVDNRAGAIAEAARKAGATDLIEGELSFREGGGFALTLRRVDLASGLVRGAYRAGGIDRLAAVDSAAAGLARALGGLSRPMAIADVATASPVAYGFYEEGLRAFHQWDLAAAKRLMEAALAEDSTFAMAAYYAWWAETALGGWGLERARQVRAMSDHLPDRDRLLVLAHTGVTLNDPAALPHADTLAVRYFDDPQAAYVAGVVHEHAGDFAGAIASFQRAIDLDIKTGGGTTTICRLCLSLRDLASSHIARDALPEAEAVTRRWIALRPADPGARDFLVTIYIRQARIEEAFREWAATDSLRSAPIDLRLHRVRALIIGGRFDEADAELQAQMADLNRTIRDEARWLAIISFRNQGRYREAEALSRQFPDPFSVPILAYETGRFADAARGFRGLAAEADAAFDDPHLRARNLGWRLTLAATAYAAAGDTATVRRLADSVEAIGAESLFGRDPRLHWFLRGLLRAGAGDDAGAVEAYRRSIAFPSDGYTRANLELGGSLLRLGRGREAIPLVRSALHGGLDGSNLYVTRTELRELLGQAFDQAGQRDSAAAHYGQVVSTWRRADAPIAARRVRVEQRLAELQR